MKEDLKIYNTLSRKKESFEPLTPPFVGMYVCGPTVYGEPHLGHARGAITFDVLFRYLSFLGYKVRYVRNITDVGHLEHDSDDGEDKIEKKARLEKLEPMEVAQYYTGSYHSAMKKLNVKSPNIEPYASAHIPEQIKMTEEIIKNGFAYVKEGSVYFNVKEYSKANDYGKLSGRVLEDLLSGTRDLDGQKEKLNAADFALWKKASPEHIMKWESPWGEGFPGWHLECSAMSSKYLGKQFDIHGGGMDLLFPHHECEIAQAKASNKTAPAKYWMHNNMITISGQKMSKSLNNFITINELLSGTHSLLERAYSPMTIKFFILQAHYRGTLDFSNEALLAANKGYKKLANGLRTIKKLQQSSPLSPANAQLDEEMNKMCKACYDGLNDDLNTAVTLAALFNMLKKINQFSTHAIDINGVGEKAFNEFKNTFIEVTENILGLEEEKISDPESLIDGMLVIYKDAKDSKQYDKIDQIRTYFKKAGLVIKDMKNGIDWAYEE
jgi:cysteinyl-tRNA synthetase